MEGGQQISATSQEPHRRRRSTLLQRVRPGPGSSAPHEDDVVGHSGQSFLGRMTNESSGQITEAVRPTAVRRREIGQGQGLPPPGSPENLPVHCGPQNTTCHSQARGVHTRPRCLDVMECVRGPTTALAKPYSTHGRSSSQARGPKRQPGLALGWGWRFVQLKPWDWAPRSQEKVMAASSTYRGQECQVQPRTVPFAESGPEPCRCDLCHSPWQSA